MNTISICLTNFNRFDLLFQSFEKVVNDDRVSEIQISDDCSNYDLYKKIVARAAKVSDKIKVSRTDTNIDCFRNKRRAVSLATNEYVILLDSDNVIGPDYLDAIYSKAWEPKQLFQPEFARPHFNFREFSSRTFTKVNILPTMRDSKFTTMLNAANYFVNRDEYLRVWDGSVDPVTSDSIWQNYCWLKAGNSIFVMPGMQYDHKTDKYQEEGSHYRKNVSRTPSAFHVSVIEKLKRLR